MRWRDSPARKRQGFNMNNYTKFKHNPTLTPEARELRKNQTPEEKKLWYQFLKPFPVSILRQKVIDRFIVDFYCAKAKLVIEIDGGYHEEYYQNAADEERTKVLEAYGCKVIRFTNEDVNRRFDEVCKTIESEIIQRIKNLPC